MNKKLLAWVIGGLLLLGGGLWLFSDDEPAPITTGAVSSPDLISPYFSY